jgi:hypothetical protein
LLTELLIAFRNAKANTAPEIETTTNMTKALIITISIGSPWYKKKTIDSNNINKPNCIIILFIIILLWPSKDKDYTREF